MSQTLSAPPAPAEPPARAPRPKKMKGDLGPYDTQVEIFDKGQRRKAYVTLVPGKGVLIQLARMPGRKFLSFGAIYDRGAEAIADFNAGPRTSTRITRGGAS